MTSSSFSISAYFIIILSVFLLIAGCSGSQAVVNETWTVVRLLDTGEEIQSTSKTLVVRYCTSKEVKEVSCSAGTSRNFSISLAGVGQLSGGLSAGAEVEGSVGIEAGVGAELGFDRQSGQTLSLDSPQKGFIRQYELTEKYTIISGKAIAQSSDGTEKEGDYIFQSSCDFTIVSEQDFPCDGQSISQPINEPTSSNEPTPADTPCEWLKNSFPQSPEEVKDQFSLPGDATVTFIYELCPSSANAFGLKASTPVELQVPSGGCIDSWAGFTEYIGDVGTPISDGAGGWRVYKGTVRAPEMTYRIIGCPQQDAQSPLVASPEINENWALGELLYEENFEDEVITGLNTRHGHFEIVEVDGNHILRTSTSSLGQISLPTTSNDYAFEVKVMQVSGEKGLGFVEIRKESGTPCDSGYAIDLDVQGGWLNLLEREKTCDELRDSGLFANTNTTLSNGVWYKLRIEAKGAEVRVYLNDKLILEDTDIDDTIRKSNIVSIATCCGDLEPFIFHFDEIKAWELAP